MTAVAQRPKARTRPQAAAPRPTAAPTAPARTSASLLAAFITHGRLPRSFSQHLGAGRWPS